MIKCRWYSDIRKFLFEIEIFETVENPLKIKKMSIKKIKKKKKVGEMAYLRRSHWHDAPPPPPP